MSILYLLTLHYETKSYDLARGFIVNYEAWQSHPGRGKVKICRCMSMSLI